MVSTISPIDGGLLIDRGDLGEGRGDGSSPGWGSNIGLPGKWTNGDEAWRQVSPDNGIELRGTALS